VARDGAYEGCLVLQDQLKPSSIQAVADLHADGRRCVMISGDNSEISAAVGKKLGVDQAIGGCLPEDKVKEVEKLKQNGTVAFVGDGVNDVPVIAAADIGFAMGGLGSDAAVEASDVVIMDDDPAKISLAIASARRILGVANQNIWFAILVKVGTLLLGAVGIANMWMAIFADTGVAMLCALNSLRLLRIARKQTPAQA
jgi:Cd2+/Zn2+-exporting ATPase